MIGVGLWAVPQPVIADAELDTGQKTVTVRLDEGAAGLVGFTGQGLLIPVGGLPVPLLRQQQSADLEQQMIDASSDSARLLELMAEKEQCDESLAAKMDEWEAVAAELEEMQ